MSSRSRRKQFKKIKKDMGNPNLTRKTRKVNYQTFSRVQKENKILKIVLVITIFIIPFLSIVAMKDANILFISNLEKEQADQISLMYEEASGVIRELNPDNTIQKIPKTSDLLYLKIMKNETDLIQTTQITNIIQKNFTFESLQNLTNIEFEEGINFKNETSEWITSGNRLNKQLILDFSFNRSFQEVKNMSLSFEFKTNYTSGDLLDDFDVEFYDFKDNDFSEDKYDENDLTNGELTVINETIDFPCLYLNRSNPISTNFRVLFHAREKLTDLEKDFDFNVSNVIVFGYFWKDVSNFNQISNITTLNINYTLNLFSSLEITENKFIFTSIINLTVFTSFGSWIIDEITVINHTIILFERIHSFDILDDNLFIDTWFGLKVYEINLNSLDLDNHFLDFKINYDRIMFWY